MDQGLNIASTRGNEMKKPPLRGGFHNQLMRLALNLSQFSRDGSLDWGRVALEAAGGSATELIGTMGPGSEITQQTPGQHLMTSL
jgi:hypothetical protein